MINPVIQKFQRWLNQSGIHNWTWHYWFLYFVVIPVILLAIPQLVQYLQTVMGPQIPPYDFLNQTFVLNVYHPTVLSMFLMNYTHLELIHLCSNLSLYLVCVSFIFFLQKDKDAFVKASGFLLLALPLLLSIASIVFFRGVPAIVPPAKGFSGIAFGLLGYVFYLACKTLFKDSLNIDENRWNSYPTRKKIWYLYFVSLLNFLLVILIMFIPISVGLFSVQGGTLVNGMAHFIGFMCGLIIPFVQDISYDRKVTSFHQTLIVHIGFTLMWYSMYLIQVHR